MKDWKAIYAPLAIALAVLAHYALTSLPGGFLYDDLFLIQGGFIERFTLGDLASYTLARPLALMTYAIDFRLAGWDAGAFHFTNILIHAANVLLCLFLAQALFKSWSASVLAALIFGFHFVSAESVNYVWARSALLSSMFMLAALLTLARAGPALSWKRALAVTALFLLGFLSRPDALLLVPLGWLLLAICQRRIWQPAYVLALLAGGVGALIVWDRLRDPAVRSMGATAESGMAQRLSESAAALLRYGELLVRPDRVSLYHPNPELGWHLWPGLLSLAVLIGLIFWKRHSVPALFGGLALLTCILFVALIPSQETVSERRIYLGIAGLAFVWASALSAIMNRSGMALAFLLPSSLMVVAAQRNLIWRQPPQVLFAAGHRYPESAQIQFLIGMHFESSQAQRAEAHLIRALDLDPSFAKARVALGLLYLESGRLARAEQHLAGLAGRGPEAPQALNGLGIIAVKRGEWQRARGYFSQALQADPQYIPAQRNLAGLSSREARPPPG